MEISVIVPTYNRAKKLHGLLEHWKKIDISSDVTYELIFSDDGSEDSTLEILDACEGLPLVIIRNEHGGASAARNAAIQVAKGERILFLGDDIYPNNDILDVHMAIGREKGEDVAVLGLVDWHPEQKQNYLLHHIVEVGNEQFSFNRLQPDDFTDFRHFYTCNVSVSKSLLDKEEVKFDPRFYKANFEDTELAYRLFKHGMKIFYAPKAYGLHYHEYDPAGFCRRQMTAGEMCTVFRSLHPEMDKFFGLSSTEVAYQDYLNINGIEDQNRAKVEHVLRRAEEYEQRLKQYCDGEEKIKDLLSILYRQLYQMKFYEGVLSQHADYNEISAKNFLYDRYFGDEYVATLIDRYNAGRGGRLYTTDGISEMERNMDLANTALNFPVKFGAIKQFKISALKRKAKNFLRRFKLVRDIRQAQLNRRLSRPVSSVTTAATIRKLTVAVVSDYDQIETSQTAFSNVEFKYIERGCDVGQCDYVYEIDSGQQLLEKWQLKNALLTLCSYRYDYVFISLSHAELPVVGSSDSTAQLLQSRAMYANSGGSFKNMKGKIIRLQPEPEDIQEQPAERFFALPSCKVNGDGQVSVSETLSALWRTDSPYSIGEYKTDKQVMFVLPIIMAVGGAERNIIEVMRKLSEHYTFVVITMERHSKRLGSLHHQVAEFTDSIYDLAEIAPQEGFLQLLSELKGYYKPDSVLVTNGSPWFLANSKNIRKLFADIPIIDHQVYDQNVGWIEHYTDSGIRSFDRFVAINKKIQSVMLTDKGLQDEQVSQIYHAVNIDRIVNFKANPVARTDVLTEFELPVDRPLYIMLARLSMQKRPLDFLAFVKKRQQAKNKEHFILVGDGVLREEVDAFISSNQLNNITHIPFINNPVRLISVAEAMIFTSEYEGLPVAMLEALSLGVPVFSTDVGDITDVLDNYNAGMTFTCDSNIDQYNEYFDTFIANQEQYKKSLEENRSKIADRFCPKTISAQYYELFLEAKKNFRKLV